MNRSATAVLTVGLLALAACGGSSASSEIPEFSANASTSLAGTPVTDGVASPSTEIASADSSVDPAELLVDSSYDIEAIDGPVVLWFWAPG